MMLLSQIFNCSHSFVMQILLLIVTWNLLVERHFVRRYDLGLQAGFIFTLFFGVICWEHGWIFSRLSFDGPCAVCTAIQLAAAFVCLLACVCLPRRPSVFHKGYMVDKQYTVSAINRWTWTWASEYLALARAEGLTLGDLPKLHYRIRSSYLYNSLSGMKQKDRLWKTLLAVHYREVIIQSLLSMVLGIVQFGPQFAMYKLLNLFEERPANGPFSKDAWTWVVGLGFSIGLSSWMEAWLQWIALARLALPMQTELSVAIFAKSMRCQNLKGAHARTSKTPEVISDGVETLDFNTSSAHKCRDTISGARKIVEDDNEDNVQRLRQSMINLVAVDTKRIADFATFHYIFLQTGIKLTVSMIFLVQLIGWRSLLAGLVVFAIITPINIHASKRYSKAQGSLMTARDRKMVVLTEALQGIFNVSLIVVGCILMA